MILDSVVRMVWELELKTREHEAIPKFLVEVKHVYVESVIVFQNDQKGNYFEFVSLYSIQPQRC